MKSDEERAKAQFEYERRHRERILTSPRGRKLAKIFTEREHYVIFAPNSKSFVALAQSLHLQERRAGETHRFLVGAGFSKIWCYAGGKGIYIRVPLSYIMTIESLLELLPQSWRRPFSSFLSMNSLLGIIMVGRK